MSDSDFDSELFHSVMSTELTDIEPYLEKFELILPDQPISPFATFTLIIKASGSDLPCDGSWFQISVDSSQSPSGTLVSQPPGDILGFGEIGEWRVNITAPPEEGDYWLHATMNSIEASEPVVKTPFKVELPFTKTSHRPFLYRTILATALLGTIFSVILLAVSMVGLKTAKQTWNKYVSNYFEKSSTKQDSSTEFSASTRLDKNEADTNKKTALQTPKTTEFIDDLLKQSLTDPNVFLRQQAWQELSQYLQSQNNANKTDIQKIHQQRVRYKQQLEKWLSTNQHPEETLKRLQVLAYVDEDKKAQRWLGNLYRSGKIVPKDLGKAWEWYQRSANNGDIEAQRLLNQLELQADELLNSQDIIDRTQGYQVAEATASAGGVNAQLWMGHRYETGDGVIRNLQTASKWYRKAAMQNNTVAKQKLDKILGLLKQNYEPEPTALD